MDPNIPDVIEGIKESCFDIDPNLHIECLSFNNEDGLETLLRLKSDKIDDIKTRVIDILIISENKCLTHSKLCQKFKSMFFNIKTMKVFVRKYPGGN